jgi:hypothetical protein
MGTTIRGPAWSRKGLDVVGGRYPLRVERHLGRLVDGLLPGVITTTTHARAYALHTLVWADAEDRGMDQAAAVEQMRRCEVVQAAITLQHEQHISWIPAPHGGDAIGNAIARDGVLNVATVAETYTPNAWGFGGVYLGSEARLGLVENRRPPIAGPRANLPLLREALGGLLELATKNTLSLPELAGASALCACAAPAAPDGPWLRSIFLKPDHSDTLEEADRARRETAQLLGRALSGGIDGTPQGAFQHALAFGAFVETDAVASNLPIALAWRGAILRNYSVGAWRRIWSWLVGLLGEPATVASLPPQRGPNDLASQRSGSRPARRPVRLGRPCALARGTWLHLSPGDLPARTSPRGTLPTDCETWERAARVDPSSRRGSSAASGHTERRGRPCAAR